MNLVSERKEKIISFMSEAIYRPLKLDEISYIMGVPDEDRHQLADILEELEKEGAIYKTNKGRYGLPSKMNMVAGRLQGNERGYGFLIPDDESLKDIFIPEDGMAGAMNNDRVIARITSAGTEGRRSEGEIIKILERANIEIVGTFEKSRYFGFVVPDDRKITGDIFIPKDEINGAEPGNKVVAEIVSWPGKRRNAQGKIVEIIGDINEPGTDVLSILKSYGLEESFPEEAVKQAEKIQDKIDEEIIEKRRDLRNLTIITIDGEDAKDLDDAVSIERLPQGSYRLGVHIADVSSYVTEHSPLDSEALKRGTSVYLVDRVIPMLPARLSNGVCSLNPNVDRLTLSVLMDIDSNGNVTGHDVFESVINTNERMTYTDVTKLLEDDDGELRNRYGYLIEELETMKELALILRKKRMDRGAIDFNFEEAKIVLDEKGKPVEVKRYETTISNRIIEEFMLVCNETIAEHFYWLGIPFVYRVHEEPENEKIMAFAQFIKNLGYTLKGVNKIHPRALQDILDKARGTKAEMIVSTVMLRSLAKARYTHQNLGHFGLAAEFYCHFTSPIRRYPDLLIHRLIKKELKDGFTEEREQEYIKKLPEIARHCSERERAADEAERETEDLKKVEYMKELVGDTFEGIISNVTSFGMFVELENTIEGLIRVSNMDDDYYIYDSERYCLTGERTGKRYRIGDEVYVRLVRADVAARQLDFILEDRPDESHYDSISGGRKIKGRKIGGRKGEGSKGEDRKGEGSKNEGRKGEGRRGEGRRGEGRKVEDRKGKGGIDKKEIAAHDDITRLDPVKAIKPGAVKILSRSGRSNSRKKVKVPKAPKIIKPKELK